MSLTQLPDHLRIDGLHGSICCERCGRRFEAPVTTPHGPLGGDEILDAIRDAAGLDEEGNCATCSRESAAEDVQDRAMRDRKAELEGAA